MVTISKTRTEGITLGLVLRNLSQKDDQINPTIKIPEAQAEIPSRT